MPQSEYCAGCMDTACEVFFLPPLLPQMPEHKLTWHLRIQARQVHSSMRVLPLITSLLWCICSGMMVLCPLTRPSVNDTLVLLRSSPLTPIRMVKPNIGGKACHQPRSDFLLASNMMASGCFRFYSGSDPTILNKYYYHQLNIICLWSTPL